MPELPEVETVKLQLQKFLIGHIIERVEIRYPKCFEGEVKNVEKIIINAVRRFGKVTVIDLSNGYSLAVHIKLTGQLIYRGPNLKNPPTLSKKVNDGLGGKHTHVILHLDKDGLLYYNDFRRFGWIKVIKTEELKTKNDFLKNLGPEPLTKLTNSEQEELTLETFKNILGKTKRAIKVLLMDQAKISGIGNIYANDALWISKIHPETPANSISDEKVCKLFEAIEEVLEMGLKTGGASELSFVTPDGAEGEYQKHFVAYGQNGKICPRCKKEKFEKKMVGGRGTYFCPVCQIKDNKASLFD